MKYLSDTVSAWAVPLILPLQTDRMLIHIRCIEVLSKYDWCFRTHCKNTSYRDCRPSVPPAHSFYSSWYSRINPRSQTLLPQYDYTGRICHSCGQSRQLMANI